MRIKNKICCISFVIFSLALIVYWGLKRTKGHYNQEMPTDFNFCANIASDSYILNTYNNTLTKTIDWEKDTTIILIVSKEFKESIYKCMKSMDIFKYPQNYAPTSTIGISPSFSYNFEYTMDSIATEINWEENTDSENRDAKRFRNIFRKIEEYIEQDERVKSLPEDGRAFL